MHTVTRKLSVSFVRFLEFGSLLLFPFIGDYLNLSQTQFGMGGALLHT
jgi:uncharacterized membrane protein YadS